MEKPRHRRGLFGWRDRRRHARNRVQPLEVWFGNQRYYTLDWSKGGLCVNTRRIVVQRGDMVTGYLGRMNGSHLERFAAVVARVAENGEVGLRFLYRGPRALVRPMPIA